jgi:hypothetical protein
MRCSANEPVITRARALDWGAKGEGVFFEGGGGSVFVSVRPSLLRTQSNGDFVLLSSTAALGDE